MTTADADHAMRVISHRCGDILGPGNLAAIERALAGHDADAIPADIAERMLEVLSALEMRLAEMRLAAMEPSR